MRSKFPAGSRNLIRACCAIVLTTTAAAAKKPKEPPPAISSIFPDGGKAGSSFTCTVAGILTKAPAQGWADHPGIVFNATKQPGVFDVTIAPETPAGPHRVRFFNDAGASPPRIFVVGKCDEIAEGEPNDESRGAQLLPRLPVTVNGRLGKAGDVDTFAVTTGAGLWLVCDLQGYALGSPMDPAMKLLDERGVEVAMSHDTHNLDPLIAYEIAKAGTYFVQIMAFAHPPAADVNLKGSPDHVYRLTITDQPYARAVWPPAVRRESSKGIQPSPVQQQGLNALATKLKPLGWNFVPEMEGAEIIADASQVPASEELFRVPTANGEPALAAIVTAPVVIEAGPNDDLARVQRIALPCAVAGRIEKPKDEDRFRFTAKKNESIEFRIRSFALHSPMDAWIRIEDSQGGILKQADDEKEGGVDPVLKWKAPADGDYVLAVGDLFSRGGWDFLYVIEAGPTPSRVVATLDANGYKLEAGKTVDLKVAVKLSGEFKGKLVVMAEGLPEGVTAKAIEVPAKGGEVKLTLRAAAEVAPCNQPFSVVVRTSTPDLPQDFKAGFAVPVTEPRGDRLINEDTLAWLTVVGRAVENKPADVSGSEASLSEK